MALYMSAPPMPMVRPVSIMAVVPTFAAPSKANASASSSVIGSSISPVTALNLGVVANAYNSSYAPLASPPYASAISSATALLKPVQLDMAAAVSSVVPKPLVTTLLPSLSAPPTNNVGSSCLSSRINISWANCAGYSSMAANTPSLSNSAYIRSRASL